MVTSQGSVELGRACLGLHLVLLRPVRVSAALSTTFFAEPSAWSTRASCFRRPIRQRAGSFLHATFGEDQIVRPFADDCGEVVDLKFPMPDGTAPSTVLP